MKLPLISAQITCNDDPTLETISLTLFVSGCVRRCEGCQNPELQVIPDEDTWYEIVNICNVIRSKVGLIGSVCFSGGDFLPLYERQLIFLVEYCQKLGLKTILYTGESYKNINFWLKSNINIITSEIFDIGLYQNMIPASSNQVVYINGVLTPHENLEINKRSIA